mmetsp:Transcript_23315/g.31185  ORF Transcript_23315/g.31185 Transcript_23315/m.31185 type:complete len:180 (+) Transcript_23315:1206-1745(+)
MIEGCDETPRPYSGEEPLDCTNEFEKNKRYFWLQFSEQDLIIDTRFESSDEQLCIVAFLPNKDDFWVLGQSLYTDYYVVHEPTRGQLKIAPTDLRKKPKMRQDSLPPEDLLNLFSTAIFAVKLISYIVICTASITFAIVVLDGKRWGGIPFLNKELTRQIAPEDWPGIKWLRENVFTCF